MILIFINIRTFTFEYSGEVISIKIFHPLENELYSRSIEFPSRKLKNFAIVKKIQGYEMVFTIKSYRKKEIKEKVLLKWLNPQQLNNLIQSLEKIKTDNDNNAEST
ncbi:hypothetical protein [Epilithonimonas sp. UC225_85]|uniref:hypothetical protein n=1 Tax=Epilithonimonas sp. UC225_85 TaxID=3350167 RepID=UPI0036D29679